jgi:hypothetical protein
VTDFADSENHDNNDAYYNIDYDVNNDNEEFLTVLIILQSVTLMLVIVV